VTHSCSPNPDLIPDNDALGVTILLLTVLYKGREFVRVGYYVNNEYSEEILVENPPLKPIYEKIRKSVLAEKPRVTRFNIQWDEIPMPVMSESVSMVENHQEMTENAVMMDV
jgi:hypothetical protein